MALLTRKALLAKQELKIDKVELGKDWVFVREMTGRERDRFEQSLVKSVDDPSGKMERDLDDFRAKLVVNTLCDENGKNLLEPGDYETLSKNMGASRLEKIVEKSQALNRITDEDKEALVKN